MHFPPDSSSSHFLYTFFRVKTTGTIVNTVRAVYWAHNFLSRVYGGIKFSASFSNAQRLAFICIFHLEIFKARKVFVYKILVHQGDFLMRKQA